MSEVTLIELILLSIYIVFSVFMLISLHIGLKEKNKEPDGYYKIFCKLLTDFRSVNIKFQAVFVFIVSIILVILVWYLILTTLLINVILVTLLHLYHHLKDKSNDQVHYRKTRG